MKHASALAVFLALGAAPAAAAETVLKLDDPSVDFAGTFGKQVNVRFSESFAKDRLPKPDIDSLTVTDAPEGKVCFYGRGPDLDMDQASLKEFARADEGDICFARADVAVRYEPQMVEGAPPMPFYATDTKQCKWVWRQGKGISVWTEDCSFESGRWDVAYNEANDWFELRVDGGDPYPVLRQFRVTGGPEALLPQLKAKQLVLDDAECVFAPSSDQFVPKGWTPWEVVPVGKRKADFDAQPGDEVPEPPCGELGYAVDFVGFFMVHADFPDRVIYVNLGQDGTMIDLSSVRLAN